MGALLIAGPKVCLATWLLWQYILNNAVMHRLFCAQLQNTAGSSAEDMLLSPCELDREHTALLKGAMVSDCLFCQPSFRQLHHSVL
jgi:hypothetical protein